MVRIKLDNETGLVEECYAVVYSRRQKRDRFPDNCVTVMDSEAEARAAANPEKYLYAARVAGPSRSSEGLMLYYLVTWL